VPVLAAGTVFAKDQLAARASIKEAEHEQQDGNRDDAAAQEAGDQGESRIGQQDASDANEVGQPGPADQHDDGQAQDAAESNAENSD